jgi:hypothetical protein
VKFVEKQMQVLRLRLAEQSAKLRSEWPCIYDADFRNMALLW